MGIQREKTFINEDNDNRLGNMTEIHLKLSAKPTLFKEARNFENVPKVEQNDMKHETLNRDMRMSPEPGEDQENVSLAVKLPDGHRIQRRFRPTHSVQTIVDFAEHTSQINFSGYKLVSNTLPKREFTNLQLNIRECNLESRTLLILQPPE